MFIMTSHIRVGRGSKIAPKKGYYRVGQNRSKMTKKRGTSLMNIPQHRQGAIKINTISGNFKNPRPSLFIKNLFDQKCLGSLWEP